MTIGLSFCLFCTDEGALMLHSGDHKCSRAVIGDCLICGKGVDLTPAFHCAECSEVERASVIENIRAKYTHAEVMFTRKYKQTIDFRPKTLRIRGIRTSPVYSVQREGFVASILQWITNRLSGWRTV